MESKAPEQTQYESSIGPQTFLLVLLAISLGTLAAAVVLPTWMPRLADSLMGKDPKAGRGLASAGLASAALTSGGTGGAATRAARCGFSTAGFSTVGFSTVGFSTVSGGALSRVGVFSVGFSDCSCGRLLPTVGEVLS